MVLVTGGTGLVGAHLLLRLLESETPVKAIYRVQSDLEKVKHLFSYYVPNAEALFDKITWIPTDLNDISGLEMAFENVTHVYHCAALISFDPRDEQMLYKINVEGTANVVNFCVAKNVQKLCYVSSIATIGRSAKAEFATEETEWSPHLANVYALSKKAAEMEVWRGSQENLPVVVVNPGVILGPGFWHSGGGTFFKHAAANTAYFPPGSTGFVGVNDVVRLMLLLMWSESSNERYILVAENEDYGAILSKIARILGKEIPQHKLKNWELNLLWRLDWFLCMFTKRRRKLTRQMAYSLKKPTRYSSEKITTTFSYKFEPLTETIAFCCRMYSKEMPQ